MSLPHAIAAAALCCSAALSGQVEIRLGRSGEACIARAAGQRFTLPDETERLEALLARIGREGGSILLSPDGSDVPYRCVGGIVFAAQRLGLRVGFVSEPPPR